MDNEKPQEASARTREMHLLANIIRQADELQLDFDSLIRVGRYLVQVGKNEQADAVRKSMREMYNRHLESLRVLGENGSELPDGQTEKILDMHCRFAEDAIRKFDSTLPIRWNSDRLNGINQ